MLFYARQEPTIPPIERRRILARKQAEPLPLAREMLERRSIRGSKTHLWVDRFALARERRSAKAVLRR